MRPAVLAMLYLLFCLAPLGLALTRRVAPASTWEVAAAGLGLVGRLDRTRLDLMLEGLDPARCVALICGPGPMVTAVSDMLHELGMPMERVIYERFDYSGGGASRQDRRRRRRFLGIGAALALGLALFVAVLS